MACAHKWRQICREQVKCIRCGTESDKWPGYRVYRWVSLRTDHRCALCDDLITRWGFAWSNTQSWLHAECTTEIGVAATELQPRKENDELPA